MFRVRAERKKCQYSHGSEARMGLQKESRGCRDGGCEKYFVWLMVRGKLSMAQPQLDLGLGLREG